MDPTATLTLRLANGQEFGPASLDDVVEWARQRRVPKDAVLVSSEDGSTRPVLDESRLRVILLAPPTEPTGAVEQPLGPDSTVHVVIPSRNPCALIAYYFAVFSIVMPFLAPLAIILGIYGVRARAKRPAVHGLAHAWVGIIGGTAVTLMYCTVLILIVTKP